jgi:ADP-dependent NAD(P)H-hydrate dehydratase / NAD(P)H-hydrate epimerase
VNELLTCEEMAEADRRAIALGIPSLTLMENAGRAVADEAAKMVAAGTRIAVLCGSGNNGGDGFVAARLLRERGFEVRVSCLVPVAQLKGDAAVMAGKWGGAVSGPDAVESVMISADLVIDALFGAGFKRDVPVSLGAIIAYLSIHKIPVLAVDLPSGIDGSSGARRSVAISAARTITFVRPKIGHSLYPGRAHCGEISVADIGIGDELIQSLDCRCQINASPVLPQPGQETHKYNRGHAVIVSGPALSSGAARLGARGALRIGAGLVTLIGNSAASTINAAHTNAVMVRRVEGEDELRAFLKDERRNAILIGPGASVGEETASDVLTVLASKAAVVLDADALTSFVIEETSAHPDRASFGFLRAGQTGTRSPASLFEAIKARTEPVVMTPHEGEFKRLFGDLKGSKLERAREAAKVSGAIIVLKGADTVIASPDGVAAINTNAPPTLATAGSGDVLAGFITGLLAQGMPAYVAACSAVWLHGECANLFGPGLIAEDLAEVLPEVLADLEGLSASQQIG